MTQAVNLANFANSLNSSGQLDPSNFSSAVPVTKGGTNASTAATARTNLGLAIGTDIPSPTGTGASGTWAINISGNASTATSATSATNATNATNATYATSAGSATNATYATSAGTANDVIGTGQTWQSPSRAANTTYQNTTGRSIMVNCATTASLSYLEMSSDASNWQIAFGNDSGSVIYPKSAIIRNGYYYRLRNDNNAVTWWYELR